MTNMPISFLLNKLTEVDGGTIWIIVYFMRYNEQFWKFKGQNKIGYILEEDIREINLCFLPFDLKLMVSNFTPTVGEKVRPQRRISLWIYYIHL